MNVIISPSILSADFARLGEQVQEAIDAGAEYIHVDVMDGHFVPPMTIGPQVVSALKPIADAGGVLLDVHLMIEKPTRLIPSFAAAGADILTVHVESCLHLHRAIQQIKELGVKAGVTLNPGTPLVALEEVLTPALDLVLIMSVNPGFGGQSYIPESTAKIARLRRMLEEELKAALEAGAEDVQTDDGGYSVITTIEGFEPVKQQLRDAGIEWLTAELTQIASNTVSVSEKDAPKVLKLIEMLQDLIVAAVNQAQKAAAELAAEKMSEVTGGLNIPGMGLM